MSPNQREGLTAQNDLTGENEYIQSTSQALNVYITGGGTGGGDVNLIEVGGAPISLGQTTASASLPVTLDTTQQGILTDIRTETSDTTSNTADIVLNTATPTLVYTGQTNVTTAGTRVALGSSQAVKSVVIKAKTTNTGLIYVGGSTVTSSNGFILSAGDTVSIDIANIATISIDSSVNGEGVSYLGSS